MIKRTFILFVFLIITFIACDLKAQDDTSGVIIDKVIAVVGSEIILYSDIEAQYLQLLQQGYDTDEDLRCTILEELLYQKLLVNQAEIDSVTVSSSQIESEMDRRLRYFINQIGSEKKLEEFYGKSINEIKEEFREAIRDQLLSQTMQAKITENIKVTPSEVRNFYNKIPKDSLPLIGTKVELAHIVKKPPVSQEQIEGIKDKLREFKNRISAGEDFSTLAVLYSDDPGSAAKGGELGFYSRGELYPEFEAVAYSLKKGEVSPIVKTKAGYHIIQMIERRGEQINVRHILLQPKISNIELKRAKDKLDSISTIIRSGELSFEEAAAKFSDDPSKANKGIIINKYTGTSNFEIEQVDADIFYIIDKMKPGDISEPIIMKTEEGSKAYRIIYLKEKTEPHQANLKEDYNFIQELALQEKQQQEIKNWISSKINNISVEVTDAYKTCVFIYDWQSYKPHN